ncbi:PIG-L family deacetylase [Streptomyces gilvosporeus]|uniref:PIG-L family deacetylase n=1 Tax=Streptomyces gilvosporeus TaxID=553510 RepID=UPI0021BC3EB4|nr:PIG-L family deacetylase [Streptomyces gilvosporeus]
MAERRTSLVTRRRLLRATGGGALAALAGAGFWARLSPGEPFTHTEELAGSGPPLADARNQSFLHVVAHADDALYFMNPNLEQGIRSGARSVTVCLTGGESDGRNAAPGTPDPVPRNRADFARARTNGLRAAHALMATGDARSPWDLEALSLLPGFQVELHTLRAAPHNQLVFLELVEARTVSAPRATSLRGLWLGVADTLPTLRPARTPVPTVHRYTRDQLIATLVALLERVRPTVVRTLDPDAAHCSPDRQSAADPRLAGLRYYDHQDHTASAYFALAALAAYRGSERGRPPVLESYLGYELGVLPNNLDNRTARRKGRVLDVYGWADGRRCGDPAGCGDRKVGGRSYSGGSRNWTRSTRLRAPGSNAWIRPAADGRLAAFAVLGGRAYCWTETRPGGGRFTGPRPLGGDLRDLLDSQIHAVRHPGGGLWLFAVRTVLPDAGRAHRRELMAAVQTGTAPTGEPLFARWQPLGSPDHDPVRSLEIGFPAAVVTPDGAVHVFVRTWGGGLAHRSAPHGRRWTPWRRLEGQAGRLKSAPDLVDGIDACVDSHGRIHVVAPSGRTVHHWVSHEPGRPPRPAAATGLPEAAGPVSLVPLEDGAVRALFRQAGTAQVLIAERQGRIGNWRVAAQCAPMGGYGRVAAAPAGSGDGMVLAARDDAGHVRVAGVQGAPGPWWTGRVPHVAAAGAVQDAAGRAVVVALGNDGRLYTVRQRAAGADAPFGAWRPAGAPPPAQAGSRGRVRAL